MVGVLRVHNRDLILDLAGFRRHDVIVSDAVLPLRLGLARLSVGGHGFVCVHDIIYMVVGAQGIEPWSPD